MMTTDYRMTPHKAVHLATAHLSVTMATVYRMTPPPIPTRLFTCNSTPVGYYDDDDDNLQDDPTQSC